MSARKRIPTKGELLQLQKLYKTDEKIGERLGGVPPYLVAYWRRKKNVPKHSQPKFSEKEILNLWERYGDDDKCGLELGISKAAFYNWRRRYGIREKPAFLKLEQLELDFPGAKTASTSTSLYGKQSLAQKVYAQAAQLSRVEVGQTVQIEPDLITADSRVIHAIEAFRESSTELIRNPNKVLVSLATCPYDEQESPAETTKQIREFLKRQGVRNLFDASEGCCHQVAVESGLVLPGQLIVGADQYAVSYGCLTAVGTVATPEKIAQIWSTGKTELTVPPTIRIDINGRRSRGVFGKDIALSVVQMLGAVETRGKAIEYYGHVVASMSLSERFTLANLTIDTGAETATCGFDSTTRRFLNGRAIGNYTPIIADKNADYEEIYQINIDQLAPMLATPNDPMEVSPVAEHEGIAVNLVVLGTSNNGRFDDLRVASEILKGKQVHEDCRLLIYPSSRTVYLEALKKGIIRVLVEAGAVVMYPGYGGLLDINAMLAGGERALATTNHSRVASPSKPGCEVFLCSPATAAASALNGEITDPTRFVK